MTNVLFFVFSLKFLFIYLFSPWWAPLPPPSPSHTSGSSQCTSPEHPMLGTYRHSIIQNSVTALKTECSLSPLQPLANTGLFTISTVLSFPYLRSFSFTRRKTGFPNSSQWGKKGIYTDKYLLVEIGNKWSGVSLLTWGFNLWPYFLSRASLPLPMSPNGPRSRGCWTQSPQRINTCSLGGGMQWSLITLGRGAYLGPNCLFIYSFSQFLFSSPLAFLKYQGLHFLSSSRVIDVITRFLVESLFAGREYWCFPC